MNRKEYLDFHENFCRAMVNITAAKNADYGADNDPFRNFRMIEHLGAASVEQGFITRMSDKFSRLSTFVQRGELSVKSETVEDTLIDLANYCALMAGYLRSKQQALEISPANTSLSHPDEWQHTQSSPLPGVPSERFTYKNNNL
jgi:hypothetical protein